VTKGTDAAIFYTTPMFIYQKKRIFEMNLIITGDEKE
jgi:hypothetical protein